MGSCCTVRGDLIRILTKLLSRQSTVKLDGIIIETTGKGMPLISYNWAHPTTLLKPLPMTPITAYPVCLVYVSTAFLVPLLNRTCRPRPGACLESSGLREVELP